MNTSRLNGSKTLVMITAFVAMIFTTQVWATSEAEQALQAEEKEQQEQLQLEYKEALKAAESERRMAEESIRAAREKLKQVSEQQRDLARVNDEEIQRQRAAQQAEMAKMHKELDRARRQLRETSREIARVDREVARARSDKRSTSFAYRTSNRPLIGVILGKSDEVGVEVLGVSPDGPAERAGIRKGDVIVAVGGQVLASIKEADNAGDALRISMKDIKADEPLTITYERQDQTIDTTIVPEIREPISWQTVTRFPSAPRVMVSPADPADPSDPADTERVISIERIVVPEIDTAQIAEQIEKLRVQIDERNIYLDENAINPIDRGYEYEFEFHEMSELGDFALRDANVWFGFSMTRGLQLAELDPQLGEYFKTDRGVLVLKAKEDNELQLIPGDVILQVGDTEVNSPAEFMRALRGLESGSELKMDIKRKRKNHKLEMTMPEMRMGFLQADDDFLHTFKITGH